MATDWLVFGIDPGIQGGLSVFRGKLPLAVTDMPTQSGTRKGSQLISVVGVRRWFAEYGIPDLVVLEQAQSLPRRPGAAEDSNTQGITSTFNYGRGFGKLEALLELMDWPFTAPRPMQWKKKVLAGLGTDKEAAIAFCRQRFPSVSLVSDWSGRGKKPSKPKDGRADALCVGYYGVLELNNGAT